MINDKKIKISNAVYQIGSASLAVCVVLLGMGRFVGIPSPSFGQVLIAGAVILVLAGMQYLSKNGKIILFCALIVPVGIVVRYVGVAQIVVYLQNYLNWLMGGSRWQKQWLDGFLWMQTVLIAVCGYFYELIANRYSMVKRITAGALMVYLLIMMFGKQQISHAGTISILSYFLFVMVEWTQASWKKNRTHSVRQHMIWIFPFLLLYLILLCVMPYSEEKFAWNFLKETVEHVKEAVINLASDWEIGEGAEFAVSMSGYSEESSLEGEVREDDRKVMQVECPVTSSGNLYLAGVINDSFDGHQWDTQWEVSDREQLIDCLETMYAVMLYDTDNRDDYCRSTNLKVRYQDIRTHALFVPRKMRSLYVGEDRQNLSLAKNNLLEGGKRKYGTEYKVTYYRMNLGNEAFETLLMEFGDTQDTLESSQREEIWLSTVSHYAGGGVEIPYTELEEYRTAMQDRYVQDVPLSSGVQEWLDRVLGPEKDQLSDIEKLKKLEEALSGFEYTLIPGAIPEEVQSASDFLDYFLLEKKEGYCTYFATAFVLLARAEGIPARYLQGYCVPMKMGEVQVLNTMAHAWPEAYIEGVGWISFEPTPGRREHQYAYWKTREERLMEETRNGQPIMENKDIPVGEANAVAMEEEGDRDNKRLPSLLGMAAGAFLCLVAIVLVLELLVSRYRYEKMAPSKRYRVQMQRNMRRLSLLGIRREEGETLQELNNRFKEKYQLSLKSIESYEQFLYGEKEVSIPMMEEMEEDRKQLGVLIKVKIFSVIQRSGNVVESSEK